MADPTALVSAALYQHVQSLSVPVFDGVPQNTPYPYVTLDAYVSDENNLLDQRVDEFFYYFNVWSEKRGQHEVNLILAELSDLLEDQDLPISNGCVVSMTVDQKSTRRDADNRTFTGSLTLRLIVQH